MPDFRNLNLHDRLNRFPPYLCLALARVRTEPLSNKQKMERLWNRQVRKERKTLRATGKLSVKPQWRRITIDELAARMNICRRAAHRLSAQKNWDEVPVGIMLAMMDACGIDLLHCRKQRLFINRGLATGKLFNHLTVRQKDDLIERSQ